MYIPKHFVFTNVVSFEQLLNANIWECKRYRNNLVFGMAGNAEFYRNGNAQKQESKTRDMELYTHILQVIV